jgi:hypothetical protein
MKLGFFHSLQMFFVRIILFPATLILGYEKKKSSFNLLALGKNFRKNSDKLFWLHRNYLRTTGWLDSMNSEVSEKHNVPIPWITYPAFKFLSNLRLDKLDVLEIGSGASTFYFSRECKSVTSFEDDLEYSNRVKKLKEKNIFEFSIIDLYPKSTKSFISKELNLIDLNELELFLTIDNSSKKILNNLVVDITKDIESIIKNLKIADIVFIDGWYRNLSIYLFSKFAKQTALLMVDNSDADYTQDGCRYLISNGFHEIEFRGIGPLNFNEWSTSFFARDLNMLGRMTK